jgi:tyrosyl-tRNA synthetase
MCERQEARSGEYEPQKINEILTRGVQEVVEEKHLQERLKSGEKLRIKYGIDPTGPQIHIGRASNILKLKQFQDAGHQVVLIVGDFTARIGDASDKTEMRKMLSEEDVKQNEETYLDQMGRVLDLSKTEVYHNSDWISKLTTSDWIKLGSLFTVRNLIDRENFSQRWEARKPIGLHELLYPIVQGYDSVVVKADVEIGGGDQRFNFIVGRELQEHFGQKPQDFLLMEMLPGTDGRKMSTSWGNVVNVLHQPEDQFGLMMSIKDHLMRMYFENCTLMPQGTIEDIFDRMKNGSLHPMEVKKRLAEELVSIYHGEAEAVKARELFERRVQRKEIPEDVPEVTTFQNKLDITQLIIEQGFAKSRKEVLRLISQNGIKVNGQVIETPLIEFDSEAIVKVGKRKYFKLILKNEN